ncbi:TetR family transcriptional regulator [Burkholderia sp. R-70006]|uniref:TetR/AcrR family transcriptional regulator n=1 Tax=Paraburkholderia domus TaxID=2793075 RepID=UPI00191317A1|nr:TetR/AcrR family transcriptional regulator [Paraburkholderia domus]MBK5050539.1 TetR family transcriptional regulator [Burkholderia sp. R-70006]
MLAPDTLPSTVILLIEIAERLFAESGVEAVSLSRIVNEGGQRNPSALHYHFGSRAGLVSQLLHMRLRHINAVRHRYLDRLEQKGQAVDVRAIVLATVRPLFDVVQKEEWGIYYVQVLAQTTLSPALRGFDATDPNARDALTRAFELIDKALPAVPVATIRRRFGFVTDTVIFSVARVLRETGREGATTTLLNQLVDFATAGLAGVVAGGASR